MYIKRTLKIIVINNRNKEWHIKNRIEKNRKKNNTNFLAKVGFVLFLFLLLT